jgi:hypothetical protein
MQTRAILCRWLTLLVAAGALACGKVDPIGFDGGGGGAGGGAGGGGGGSGGTGGHAGTGGRGGGGGGGGDADGGNACSGLDESACTARSDCKAYYCQTSCTGGPTFVACSTPDMPPPIACPAVTCPSSPCSQVTTLAACEARLDCHSVFVDPGTCNCATVGCCAHFSFCATGDQAQCHGAIACAIAQPYCESPAYQVSYANNCYEGCVQAKDCAP